MDTTGNNPCTVCIDFGHSHAFTSSFESRRIPCKRLPYSHLPIAAWLVLVATLSFGAANAQDTMTFHVPPNVTLCEPINLVWTGGSPPYRLDIEPLLGSTQETSENERHINIMNTSFTWIPDFPTGTDLQIGVIGNDANSGAGGHSVVLPSSNSSCLNTASTTTSQISPSSSVPSSSTAIAVPTFTPQAPTLRGGLSKGAIVGIAVAVSLVGIGLILSAIWFVLRRRTRVQQPGM